MNTTDLAVLRALARLTRARKTVDSESIAMRATGSNEEARASIARLARASLVDRSAGSVRLTMMGLAIAVSSSPAASASRVERSRTSKRRAA